MADKRIPASEIRRVWRDETLSGAEAAAAVGLTLGSLRARAKALGLGRQRRAGRRLTMPAAEFEAMWRAGVGPAEIARHFGVCRMTPWQTARRMGLPGWARGAKRISIAEYREAELGRRMAEAARLGREKLRAARRTCPAEGRIS